MATVTNIRVMVPAVRRAIEGVVPPPSPLSDDMLKDITADALADVMLYTGAVFGKTLIVTAIDDVTHAPTEYATSDALTLGEQRVVSRQAALDYFFFQFAGMKVSESIADEAQTWDWARSAQLLRQQLQILVDERDKALEALTAVDVPDQYISYLAVRDMMTSRWIEPWVEPHPEAVILPGLPSGQEDFRFGGGW